MNSTTIKNLVQFENLCVNLVKNEKDGQSKAFIEICGWVNYSSYLFLIHILI